MEKMKSSMKTKDMHKEGANGGDITNCKKMDMSTTEYNRKCGSDGFSKNGGKC
jgi:hypothetical protein